MAKVLDPDLDKALAMALAVWPSGEVNQWTVTECDAALPLDKNLCQS